MDLMKEAYQNMVRDIMVLPNNVRRKRVKAILIEVCAGLYKEGLPAECFTNLIELFTEED